MAGVIDAAAHAHEAVALGEATEEVRSTVPLNPLTRASPPLIDDGQLALAGSDGGRIPHLGNGHQGSRPNRLSQVLNG
jgi:hypothetical protein